MDKPPRTPPPYAIASVDHALRIAVMLQLEGPLTVSEVAERLGVARSTAHRLLAMLVYRDFAAQDERHAYHAGAVLQLAGHSRSHTALLRSVALPHLRRLVDLAGETANLSIRTGDTARFIASVECAQALRVGSREGMVFPAHLTTGGLLTLADLPVGELDALYSRQQRRETPVDGPDRTRPPDLTRLKAELARIRRNGFVVNQDRSERGVVAVGVAVRVAGAAVAGLAVSLPSVRYDRHALPFLVGALQATNRALESDLARGNSI